MNFELASYGTSISRIVILDWPETRISEVIVYFGAFGFNFSDARARFPIFRVNFPHARACFLILGAKKNVLFRQCSSLWGPLFFPPYFRHAVTIDHHVTKIRWKNLFGDFGFAKDSLSLISWGSNARCTHNCPGTPCTIISSCFALVITLWYSWFERMVNLNHTAWRHCAPKAPCISWPWSPPV